MNYVERHDLAVKTADSIFEELTISLMRARGLFRNSEEALTELVFPMIKTIMGVSIGGDIAKNAGDGYTGEIRDICLLLNNKDQPWTKSIADISAIAGKGNAKKVFKPGDYMNIPVLVPEDEIVDGVEFPAISGNVNIVITAVYDDKVIFNFENVLFNAAMNNENTNEGGFSNTALARYLNGYFLKCVFSSVEDHLLPNRDNLKISLPTPCEVFGREKNKTVNWGESIRHPYFEKCTNRIKVNKNDLDDTNWWWTSIAYGSTYFSHVRHFGELASHTASSTDGGVAPAFCVR
jgi:hypothetical protein